MLKRIKYNVIHELSPQGSRTWLNQACRKCVAKMGINNFHYSLGLLHFPITKIPRGVMKKLFHLKHIILITTLSFFVIGKCSIAKL